MRIQYQTIVCATDLSDNAHLTLQHSVALAREFESRLLVCHVVDLPTPSMYGEAYLAPEEHLNRNPIWHEINVYIYKGCWPDQQQHGIINLACFTTIPTTITKAI